MKYSIFIKNSVEFAFWRFLIIFTFATICNKLFKLKLPQEFRSVCNCSFITTNKGTEQDSLDTKVEVFELYYKLEKMEAQTCSFLQNGL